MKDEVSNQFKAQTKAPKKAKKQRSNSNLFDFNVLDQND